MRPRLTGYDELPLANTMEEEQVEAAAQELAAFLRVPIVRETVKR